MLGTQEAQTRIAASGVEDCARNSALSLSWPSTNSENDTKNESDGDTNRPTVEEVDQSINQSINRERERKKERKSERDAFTKRDSRAHLIRSRVGLGL